GGAGPHPRGSRDACMAQDTRVVVKHLDEDIPPETAQPLTIPEHASGAARSLVNRFERPHLHICNGSDRIRRGPSGNTALFRGRFTSAAAALGDYYLSRRMRRDNSSLRPNCGPCCRLSWHGGGQGCHPPAAWDQVEGFSAMSMGPPGRQ